MVNIRPLPANEAADIFPKRGGLDIAEYTEALKAFEPGDSAEVELNGLTARAVKRRMGSAAKKLGVSLKWAKYNDGDELMVFQVRTQRTPRTGTRGRRNSRTLVTA